jgi:hypothetical protein
MTDGMSKKDSLPVSPATADPFERLRQQTPKLDIVPNRPIFLTGLALVALSVAACNGGSSSSSPAPTVPTPTTTSVTVTVASPLRMGQTTQATGTETLSSGQSQPVTTAWQSDAPSVATVTGAGLVSGVANGRATIFVIAGGRQGQQVVRVVPDYQGNWDIGQRVTSCTESGFFVDLDFCDEFPTGSVYGITMNVAQTGEQITATPDYGAGLVLTTVSAPIAESGATTFIANGRLTESGLTIIVDATFALNSARVGELTGTISEVWRFPNISGEGRLSHTLVFATRSAGPGVRTASPKSVGLRELTDVFAGARGRRK